MKNEYDFEHMVSHPNRIRARKNKPGGSCRMCKPWKHKWENKFKERERSEYKQQV